MKRNAYTVHQVALIKLTLHRIEMRGDRQFPGYLSRPGYKGGGGQRRKSMAIMIQYLVHQGSFGDSSLFDSCYRIPGSFDQCKPGTIPLRAEKVRETSTESGRWACLL
jgi:hypothetical protein